MKTLRALLLMPGAFADRAIAAARAQGVTLQPAAVDSRDALLAACSQPLDILISFGTSVIVPEAVLNLSAMTPINVHAASPEYPGRDPHHFAVFDGVVTYGATMHVMTRHVDAGPIVDVESFAVGPSWRPVDLLRRANDAGFVLLDRLFASIAANGRPPLPNGRPW